VSGLAQVKCPRLRPRQRAPCRSWLRNQPLCLRLYVNDPTAVRSSTVLSPVTGGSSQGLRLVTTTSGPKLAACILACMWPLVAGRDHGVPDFQPRPKPFAASSRDRAVRGDHRVYWAFTPLTVYLDTCSTFHSSGLLLFGNRLSCFCSTNSSACLTNLTGGWLAASAAKTHLGAAGCLRSSRLVMCLYAVLVLRCPLLCARPVVSLGYVMAAQAISGIARSSTDERQERHQKRGAGNPEDPGRGQQQDCSAGGDPHGSRWPQGRRFLSPAVLLLTSIGFSHPAVRPWLAAGVLPCSEPWCCRRDQAADAEAAFLSLFSTKRGINRLSNGPVSFSLVPAGSGFVWRCRLSRTPWDGVLGGGRLHGLWVDRLRGSFRAARPNLARAAAARPRALQAVQVLGAPLSRLSQPLIAWALWRGPNPSGVRLVICGWGWQSCSHVLPHDLDSVHGSAYADANR